MNESKMKKIIGASVACGILLLSILLSITLYQIILRVRTSQQIERLEEQKRQLQEERKNTEDEIEIWMQDWKIDEIARELGYYYGDDKQ